MSYRRLLNKTGTVQRATVTYDDYRETTLSWTTSSTLQCAFYPKIPRATILLQGQETETDGIVYVMFEADINPSVGGGQADRIVISSVTYDVKGVVEPGSRGKFKKLAVLRVG